MPQSLPDGFVPDTPGGAGMPAGFVPDRPADFKTTNARDEQGHPVVADIASAWQWLNTSRMQTAVHDAANAIADWIDKPSADRSLQDSITRGAAAGMVQGAGDVLGSFTTPIGLAMTLATLGESSGLVKAVPALKSLLALPQVQKLRRAVQVGAGTGFALQGASDTLGMDRTLGQRAQGLTEMAAGTAAAATGVRPSLAVAGGAPVAAVPRLTPQEAATNTFADQAGIPLDAATRTGSRTLRAMQKRTANSIGGEGTAERLVSAQQEGLQRAGADLAARTGVDGPRTPEQGGAAANTGLQRVIEQLHADATSAYDQLRAIEAQAPPQTVPAGPPRTIDTGVLDASGRPVTRTETPTTQVQLAVNVGRAKAALQQLYARLSREAELTPLMGDKGRALVALDRLMTGPDIAPLSVVDGALGDLKAMARGATMPELRTEGQGAAALAVRQLDAQVRATAAQAGPDALTALERGRTATTEKHQAAGVLEQLRDEPVQTFQRLTARGDSQVALLRRVSDVAPNAMPEIARAWLDQLLDQATERGRFDHADRLYTTWRNLGPETKKLLFPDGAHRAALEQFFFLAKRLNENPNPSGTAHVNNVFNWASTVASYPGAKLLQTPGGAAFVARLMHFRLPEVPTPGAVLSAAQQAAMVQVATAARAFGLPLAAGGVAQDSSEPDTGSPR